MTNYKSMLRIFSLHTIYDNLPKITHSLQITVNRLLPMFFLLLSLVLLLPEDTFFLNKNTPSSADRTSSLSVEDRILRLHILAENDDTASQEIKLHVRDAVLARIQDAVADASDAKEAEAAILPLLADIVTVANQTLEQYGVSYRATAELTTEFFPIKQYGSLLLPPGEYRALRIVLGEGAGRNWWCMLYPSLCFTEGITATLPEEEKENLHGLFTEEEYDLLFSKESGKETQPVFCFRLWEIWKNFRKKH